VLGKVELGLWGLLYFAKVGESQLAIEKHAKDCREFGVETVDRNYLDAWAEAEKKSSSWTSWFDPGSFNALDPKPPAPPLDTLPARRGSLRRRIFLGVVKGTAKGVGKGVKTLWDEVQGPSKSP
jgi:hypothetical protein